jgi:hypothetical protein
MPNSHSFLMHSSFIIHSSIIHSSIIHSSIIHSSIIHSFLMHSPFIIYSSMIHSSIHHSFHIHSYFVIHLLLPFVLINCLFPSNAKLFFPFRTFLEKKFEKNTKSIMQFKTMLHEETLNVITANVFSHLNQQLCKNPKTPWNQI